MNFTGNKQHLQLSIPRYIRHVIFIYLLPAYLHSYEKRSDHYVILFFVKKFRQFIFSPKISLMVHFQNLNNLFSFAVSGRRFNIKLLLFGLIPSYKFFWQSRYQFNSRLCSEKFTFDSKSNCHCCQLIVSRSVSVSILYSLRKMACTNPKKICIVGSGNW